MQTVVFDFLNKLAQNNEREWFNANKALYEQAKAEAQNEYEAINNALVNLDDISKYRMYRIYRDVRFSTDKSPYKTHFGGIYSRRQPQNRGSFYVQIAPGDSFVAGGFWGPEKDDLLRIRQAIAKENELELLLNDSKAKARFGQLEGEQLKTAPKDFDKTHPRIELIRYKQFYLMQRFSDEQVLSDQFVDLVAESYQAMRPFFEYMTEVLTLDENGVPLYE